MHYQQPPQVVYVREKKTPWHLFIIGCGLLCICFIMIVGVALFYQAGKHVMATNTARALYQQWDTEMWATINVERTMMARPHTRTPRPPATATPDRLNQTATAAVFELSSTALILTNRAYIMAEATSQAKGPTAVILTSEARSTTYAQTSQALSVTPAPTLHGMPGR
jgi:hypothetical protein